MLQDHTKTYSSLGHMVDAGTHLEHFHQYTRVASAESTETDQDTIDLHTDQGLFIAFTPAFLEAGTTINTDTNTDDVGVFYVELQVRSIFSRACVCVCVCVCVRVCVHLQHPLLAAAPVTRPPLNARTCLFCSTQHCSCVCMWCCYLLQLACRNLHLLSRFFFLSLSLSLSLHLSICPYLSRAAKLLAGWDPCSR